MDRQRCARGPGVGRPGSPKARQVFLLSQLEGLTYRQIAVEMKLSDRMVKKYMAQAMLHCMQADLWADARQIIAE